VKPHDVACQSSCLVRKYVFNLQNPCISVKSLRHLYCTACHMDIQLENTHTHTHTHNSLTAFCPGLPGKAGTRRNIHPLTPILIIGHPLSSSSIYNDPWHPPYIQLELWHNSSNTITNCCCTSFVQSTVNEATITLTDMTKFLRQISWYNTTQ